MIYVYEIIYNIMVTLSGALVAGTVTLVIWVKLELHLVLEIEILDYDMQDNVA